MKFKYGTRRRALEYEKAIAQWWKENKTFEKSVEQRDPANSYVFYDGPPFITGDPHFGTLLSSIVKDVIPRYQTMKGKRVERRWGWDCHGLPAENFVEKQLGITDRREIGTKISLEEYITKARESMVANSETWEQVIDRIGRWVDFKGAYRTMDKDFMESVWWAFAELYKKGKIYEGKKVLMYDTKFATPVSKNEVTMDNDAYQTVTDPSVYVKFRVRDDSKHLLAWTTTPWTLPANMALAVNPKLKYVEAEVDGENLILAKDLVGKVLADEKHQPLDYKIVREMTGKDLVGTQYVPLFPEENGSVVSENAHKIYAADFVENEGGTGIVHIAPAYGEDDFALAEKHDIPVIDVLDDEGFYLPEMQKQLHKIGVKDTGEQGIECWEGNKFIAKCLQEAGVVWKIDYIRHEYPFNPRSGQRIMYRAFPSWFFDVAGQKPLMLEQNENINWFPAHIKHGRFAKNIEAAPDWNLSRDRFWATAMPVWKGDRGTVKVVGSYAELEQLSGARLDDYHRPWVDEIEFDLPAVDLEKVKIESGRLTLVPISLDYNQDIFNEFDDEVTRYLMVGPNKNLEEVDNFIKNSIERRRTGDKLDLIILDKRGEFLGICNLNKLFGKTPEFGLWLKKSAQGKGYGTEIIFAIAEWANIHLNFTYLKYRANKENVGSWKIAEKLVEKYGGKYVGEVPEVVRGKDTITKEYEILPKKSKKLAETEHFTRIDKVLDCWFESGSMPFAQLHYPFENKEKFEKNYPADFIVEYVAQVRAWFYYVHVVNTALASSGAFGEMKDVEVGE